MLLSVERLHRFFGLRPSGVLHVGAHEAEEAGSYATHRWGPVIWVEMLPEKYSIIRDRFAGDPRNVVLQAACWDVDGITMPFFRATNSGSSSLLAPEQHLEAHPEIKFSKGDGIATSRLDTLLPANPKFDFLNLDIQGAELKALRGMGFRLASVKWACIEVSTKRIYAGCPLIGDIDTFMTSVGFTRIVTRMSGSYGWGEALYANTGMLPASHLRRLRIRAALWNAYYAVADLPRAIGWRSLSKQLRGSLRQLWR